MVQSQLLQEVPSPIFLLHLADEVLLLDSVHLAHSRSAFYSRGMEPFSYDVIETYQLAFASGLDLDVILVGVFYQPFQMLVPLRIALRFLLLCCCV